MPKGFQKGNTLGKQGTIAREENKQNLWEYMASGGARQYNEKLNDLANGKDLSKPEQQFMDRSERLFPYVKARKTDVTTDGEKIQVSPILGGLTEDKDEA